MFRTTKEWSFSTKRTQFTAPTYMESVNEIMSLKQTVRDIDSTGWQEKTRIDLPTLENLDILESQFTVLDPIRIQIEYVQVLVNYICRITLTGQIKF
jgi:hypothetical protein